MQGENPPKVEPLFGLGAAPRSDVAEGAGAQGGRLERLAARRNALAARGSSPRSGTGTLIAAGEAQAIGEVRSGDRRVRRLEQRLKVVPPAQVAEVVRNEYVLPVSRRPTRSYGSYIGFFLCVIVPTIVVSIYLWGFASNQYVAEFRFSVQDTSPTATTTAAATSIMALAGASGSANNTNYVVADFLTSREVVEELQKRINVVSLYSKPQIDWWDRFNSRKPLEKFVTYWQGVSSANYDPVTGIAVATVRAFSPEDALLVGKTMVELSEELVNRIAGRAAKDAVKYAQQEVNRAQQRLREISAKMRDYRNRVGVIDPTASVSASNATLIQNQRAMLAQLQTQLDSLTRQNLKPNAPVIISLTNQIKAVREQLAQVEADVGHGVNGASLSKVVGEYEDLKLDQQFAQSMLTSTMQALDQARANAAAQHLYITPYVRPNLPRSSTYPDRPFMTAVTAFFGFAFWIVALLIIRSIRERFA